LEAHAAGIENVAAKPMADDMWLAAQAINRLIIEAFYAGSTLVALLMICPLEALRSACKWGVGTATKKLHDHYSRTTILPPTHSGTYTAHRPRASVTVIAWGVLSG
jgi:hypothetical protein